MLDFFLLNGYHIYMKTIDYTKYPLFKQTIDGLVVKCSQCDKKGVHRPGGTVQFLHKIKEISSSPKRRIEWEEFCEFEEKPKFKRASKKKIPIST